MAVIDPGTGAVIGGAISALPALFGGGKTTARQEALLTPEQKTAQQDLSAFSQTGKLGNFTAGEEIGLGFGDFDATQLLSKTFPPICPVNFKRSW